jgi:hypothetical protein
MAVFHDFSGDSFFAATDVMLVDDFSGDSFFAATEIGGVWVGLKGVLRGRCLFFVRTFSHDKNLTK